MLNTSTKQGVPTLRGSSLHAQLRRTYLRSFFMKIHFIYSSLYESVLAEKPISYTRGSKAAQVVSAIWKKEAEKIERALYAITGLRFKKKEIDCYLNSRRSFSEPLSLLISSPLVMRDNLTHELIHILLTQNIDAIKTDLRSFHAAFHTYDFVVRIHILVHAIHLSLAQTIYPSRIKSIRSYATSKSYRLSWKIVSEKGRENILKMMFGSSSSKNL